jgi:hypothetical protein
MNFYRHSTIPMAIVSICLGALFECHGQISSINSAFVNNRVLNGVPGATLTSFNLYPSIVLFGESGVSAPSGSANRDVWQFSNNGGASAYQFQNTNYFDAAMTLQLTGSPVSPRKEAGFLLSTANFGDIQFIVNTDGHDVVQFGGISFYSFSSNNIVSYNSGDTIRLGIDYYPALDGNNAIQFFANGNASPIFEFAPGSGIGDGSTLGGFFQIENDSSNPANFGLATFQNITIIPIPEPSKLALLVTGMVTLLTFGSVRRRNR